ncbi:MAG: cytochrome c maturation protein CcmE [Acidimicrobiales bacterium]|jgi:cytochrome c-type biogenesis protein CcmE|nr:cytochrome c maturation protein CcmE [Acidimicrobiales bacterium]
MDVTPREAPTAPARRSKLPAIVILLVVAAGIGFVLSQALRDSAFYFYNADEAVAKQQELGDSRFRLQGKVLPGTTERTAEGVEFDVAFNGVAVPVRHTGDPAELFQDDIPVVLEGSWQGTGDGAFFASDYMVVKHDETYEADNAERITEAEAGTTGDAGDAP